MVSADNLFQWHTDIVFFGTEYVKTRPIRPWKRSCCRPTISAIQPALSRTERHPPRLDLLRELLARRCCFAKKDMSGYHTPLSPGQLLIECTVVASVSSTLRGVHESVRAQR